MIGVEDWAEIRRLHRAEGMGIKAIARRLGLARNTAREALRSDAPPRYQRAAAGSRVDAFDAQIRDLLREFPAMPATVIAERIGWPHGITVLRERVSELRPLSLASPVMLLPPRVSVSRRSLARGRTSRQPSAFVGSLMLRRHRVCQELGVTGLAGHWCWRW